MARSVPLLAIGRGIRAAGHAIVREGQASRLRPLTQLLIVVILVASLVSVLVIQPTARRSEASRARPSHASRSVAEPVSAPTVPIPLPTTTLPPAPSTTNTTRPPVSTSTAPPANPGIESSIGVANGHLVLNGKPYTFVGVNAYEIGTVWGTNAGCGDMVSQAQLNQLFSSMPANSLVRFWAYQETIATDVHTGLLDWAPLDRVFNTAAAYHQRLVVALTGQGSGCDAGHWQDPSWYMSGFKQVFNTPSDSDGKGLMPLSYWQYMQDVVNRYKGSPALGMWEPVSEPEASTCPVQYQPTNCSGHQTCPNEAAAAQALRHFFDAVGGEIHSLDPHHLVESGLLGSGQCGASGSDYAFVSASPGIDVLSYHDYYPADEAIGGDQWNGLAVRFSQAASLGKPIIGGELGITAGNGAGCLSLGSRASDVRSKIGSQMHAGSSGVLVWDWLPSLTSNCAYDTISGDPLMTLIDQGVAGAA